MVHLFKCLKKNIKSVVALSLFVPSIISAQVVTTFKEWETSVEDVVRSKRATFEDVEKSTRGIARMDLRAQTVRRETLQTILDETMKSFRALFGMAEVPGAGWRIKQEYMTKLSQATDGNPEDRTYYRGRWDLLKQSFLLESKWVVGNKSLGFINVPTLPDYFFPLNQNLVFAHCSPYQRKGWAMASTLLTDILTALPRETMPDAVMWGPLEMDELTFSKIPEGLAFPTETFRVFSEEEISLMFPGEMRGMIHKGVEAIGELTLEEGRLEEKIQREQEHVIRQRTLRDEKLKDFRAKFPGGLCLLDRHSEANGRLDLPFGAFPAVVESVPSSLGQDFMFDLRKSLQKVVDIYIRHQNRTANLVTLQEGILRRKLFVQSLIDDLTHHLVGGTAFRRVIPVTDSLWESVAQQSPPSSMGEQDLSNLSSSAASHLSTSFTFEEDDEFGQLSVEEVDGSLQSRTSGDSA